MYNDYTLITNDPLVVNPESRAFVRRIDLCELRCYDSGGGLTPNVFIKLRWKGNQVRGHNGRDVAIPITVNAGATLANFNPGTFPLTVMQAEQNMSQKHHNHMEFELLDENDVPLVYDSFIIWFRVHYDTDVYYPETTVRQDYIQRTLHV